MAVVYQHLPHYRESIFRTLSESRDVEYHFIAAPSSASNISTIPFDSLPRTHRVENQWIGPFLVQRRLGSILREIAPDATIFLGDYRYLTTWTNAAKQRIKGKHTLFWTQGWRAPESGPRAIVRRLFYRIADEVLVYGPRARDIGISAGFDPTSVLAIGNSLSTLTQVHDTPTELEPSSELRIGAVMRLSPNKKVTQLADIARSLEDGGIRTRIRIAGDGPDTSRLQQECHRYSIPLDFVGPLHDRDELALFYRDLDVCVIPGAAGLSVLQALEHGRPVITNTTMETQGPEVEAITPGCNGDIVPEDDVAAFARAARAWGSRIKSHPDEVQKNCVDSLANLWVADHQATLITTRILRRFHRKTKVAVINPNARIDQYGGPTIFMDRLFSGNDSIEATIVAGTRDAVEAFPWAEVVVPTQYTRSGRTSQLKWLGCLTWWLLLNARRFDAIHAHGIYLFNLVPLWAALARRVPTILVPLGEGAELGFARTQRKQPLGRTRRFIISRASLGLGLSHATRLELIAAGMPPGRVHPIGNPVDTDEFAPPAKDSRFLLRKVGFVGALSENKSPELILEALALLRSEGTLPDLTAVFIGPFYSRDFERKFTKRIQQLNLGQHVEVAGFTSNVIPRLHEMSLFVLPSQQEGLPGSLVESMSTGLPAVVTDVGAMGDVVRAADCGVVVERSAEQLALGISAVLSDQSKWSQMSLNARTHAVEAFSIAAVRAGYRSAIHTSLK